MGKAPKLTGYCRGKLPAIFLLLAPLCVVVETKAHADFYRYLGDNDVEVFTNTPTGNGAVRVLREGRPKTQRTKAAKIEPKRAPETVANLEPKWAPETVSPLSAQEPLLPVDGIVTSLVGWRHDPIDGGIRHHNGVDIAVATGTRVKAIAAGRVVESAWRGGYGNMVTIEHPDGMVSIYGHNSRLDVRIGEQVEAGQTIALSGSTGRSTGPHLHFELWKRGSNVTEAYLRTGAGIPEVSDGIRSYLHSDGSIVFTNNR